MKARTISTLFLILASFIHASDHSPPIRGKFISNEVKTLKWMREVDHPMLIALRAQKKENDTFGKLIVVWEYGTLTSYIKPDDKLKQDVELQKVDADHWVIPEVKTESMYVPQQNFHIISKDEYYTECQSNFEKDGKKVPLREYFSRLKTESKDEPSGAINSEAAASSR